jgi:hypothetical protein
MFTLSKSLFVGGLIVISVVMSVGQGGPRIKPTGQEACVITPDPAVNNQDVITIRGTGFQPLTYFVVSFTDPKYYVAAAQSDDHGDVTFTMLATFAKVGQWTASIYLDNHKYYWQPDRKAFSLASCEVTVQ